MKLQFRFDLYIFVICISLIREKHYYFDINVSKNFEYFIQNSYFVTLKCIIFDFNNLRFLII